ncbi:MAG: hypothetical protein ACKVE4_08645 [Dissulfuribacterales bacterium]
MSPVKNIIRRPVFLLTAAVVFSPDVVLAIQIHGMSEGIYVHQIAHLFFMISMGFFIHWLRRGKLVKETGWRYIQYMAFFFILWNLDVFILHLLDEQLGIIHVSLIDLTYIRIQASNGMRWLEIFYYLAKLDYLFCVPALVFLNLGLSHLLSENHSNAPVSDPLMSGLSRKDDK